MLRDTPTSARDSWWCYNNNWKNHSPVQSIYLSIILSRICFLLLLRYFLGSMKWDLLINFLIPEPHFILGYITNIHSSLSLLNSFFLPFLSYIYCISAPLWLRSWFANWAPTLFVDHWIKLRMFSVLQFHYWMRESKQKKNLPGGTKGLTWLGPWHASRQATD